MISKIGLIYFILFGFHAFAQQKLYNKYDFLHGKLNAFRACYDVKCYNISLKVVPEKKYIEGLNRMTFVATQVSEKIQLDLDYRMSIQKLVMNNEVLNYKRDSSAIFVQLNQKLQKGKVYELYIYFAGAPRIAVKPPWDGGFVWKKDDDGNPFIGVACEGIGPSIWLPGKDHWSDEPDSMKMQLSVPTGLTGVSNGKLVHVDEPNNGYQSFHWKVSYPINMYGITVNIGKYTHLHDSYLSILQPDKKPLEINYYVLEKHRVKAQKHFEQVQPMMRCFERLMGEYPFWNDGYKLVESPYWGMEHQSCVAYGNDFTNNRYNFDFIIIHESAHEWFANAITANDPADMWIHESFTTYAEALYVECISGHEDYVQYLKDQKREIKNKFPLLGPRDVYFHKRSDNDIYYKGSWILHTLRSTLDNDSIFFGLLKGIVKEFSYTTINTETIINFINTYTARNLNPFFDQYLKSPLLPVIEYKIIKAKEDKLIMKYRLADATKGFEMAVKVNTTKGKWDFITPTKSWQLIDLNYFDENDFAFQHDYFLIQTRKLK